MQPDSAHKPLLTLVDSVHIGAATSHDAAFFVSARARTFASAGRRKRCGQARKPIHQAKQCTTERVSGALVWRKGRDRALAGGDEKSHDDAPWGWAKSLRNSATE